MSAVALPYAVYYETVAASQTAHTNIKNFAVCVSAVNVCVKH